MKRQIDNEYNQIAEKKEDLKMLETDLNQQKLRLLLKFDKIKFLEDFHNMREDDEINLDVELQQNELYAIAEKVFIDQNKKFDFQESNRLWASSYVIKMLKTLLKKRYQTKENVLRYSFYLMKIKTQVKAT